MKWTSGSTKRQCDRALLLAASRRIRAATSCAATSPTAPATATMLTPSGASGTSAGYSGQTPLRGGVA